MLYIVLPVHNRRKTTEKFILSLLLQTFKDFKLILIDDGSVDGTTDMVLLYLPNTIVIKGDGNLWWAGALQKAYDWLINNANNEDICLIINDDVILEEDFLELGVNILSKYNKVLLGSQCYDIHTGALLDKGVYVDWRRLKFEKVSPLYINCLSTRGLFLRVGDLKNIGGFYPRFLPHYLSDYEYTIRASRKGYKLITVDKLKLYVNWRTTGFRKNIKGLNFKDFLEKYFSNRNLYNPFHWIIFIWLACPYPWKIYNILRILWKMAKDIMSSIFTVKK